MTQNGYSARDMLQQLLYSAGGLSPDRQHTLVSAKTQIPEIVL